MKQLRFSSFRQRLNAAFLAVSLVPVLLCSALLLQIFRLRMTADQQQNAEPSGISFLHLMHSMFPSTFFSDCIESNCRSQR